MFSSTAKLIQAASLVAVVAGAALAPNTASASIFGSIARVVTHPAKAVKAVEHDVASTVKEVEHPKQLVKDVVHSVKDGEVHKILQTAGKAVGTVYDDAAKLSADIPVAKDFRPLMRDAARAARSSEGELAAAAGGALAVATGGVSVAATQAGGWGYAAFAGKREVNRAEAAIKAREAELKAQANAVKAQVNTLRQ
jgi:hypothetical protein